MRHCVDSTAPLLPERSGNRVLRMTPGRDQRLAQRGDAGQPGGQRAMDAAGNLYGARLHRSPAIVKITPARVVSRSILRGCDRLVNALAVDGDAISTQRQWVAVRHVVASRRGCAEHRGSAAGEQGSVDARTCCAIFGIGRLRWALADSVCTTTARCGGIRLLDAESPRCPASRTRRRARRIR